MTAMGQSRRFAHAPTTSASPSTPDVFRRRSERSKRARSRSRQLSFDQPIGTGRHDDIARFLGVLVLRGGDLMEPRLLGLGLVLRLSVALERLLQLAAGLAVDIDKKRNPVDRHVTHSNTAGMPDFCFAAVALRSEEHTSELQSLTNL